jgi:hypothetical protein
MVILRSHTDVLDFKGAWSFLPSRALDGYTSWCNASIHHYDLPTERRYRKVQRCCRASLELLCRIRTGLGIKHPALISVTPREANMLTFEALRSQF